MGRTWSRQRPWWWTWRTWQGREGLGPSHQTGTSGQGWKDQESGGDLPLLSSHQREPDLRLLLPLETTTVMLALESSALRKSPPQSAAPSSSPSSPSSPLDVASGETRSVVLTPYPAR